jgi:diguanylate cyclase (GGDEF)-like protein
MYSYHPKLIEHMVIQTPKAVLGLILVSLIYSWTYWHYIPSNILFFWILSQTLFIAFRFKNALILKQSIQQNNIQKTKHHIIYFSISIIISAFIWTSATILGVIFAPSPYEFSSLIMIVGIITAGVLSLASIFYIYVLYFFLMILPQIAIMFFYATPTHISIATYLLISIPIIMLLSKTVFTNHLHTISINESLGDSVNELYKLSITDSLTATYNRHYFFQEAHNFILAAQRENKPISLLMIDIDHFKDINDTYGHQAGDIILSELSREIKNLIRKSDIFARVGGEEFILLLNNTSLDGAKIIAEKIRMAIETKHFIYEDTSIAVTISIGSSSLNRDNDTLDSLYQRADIQLYNAKELGRNKVC